MKSKTALQARGMSVSILLAATAVLLLQLPGGGALTATEPNEAMSAPPASAPAANSAIAELVNLRNAHTRVWEVGREVETTLPHGRTTVETVKSRICEKASGLCYKDADGEWGPEDPSAVIVSPQPGATITGPTAITVHAEDGIGLNPGVSELHLFWNGHRVLAAYPDAEDTSSFAGEWETNSASNGEGILLAVAVDYDGDVGVSPPISLTADNLMTCLSADRRSINPNFGQTLTVTAVFSQAVPWDLKIVNPDDEGAPPFANVASGQGLYMFAQWDGTDDGGQPLTDAPYEYRLHAGTSSQTMTGTAAVQRTPGFAIEVALFAPYNERIDRKLFWRLHQIFWPAEIASVSFFGKDASWENFQYCLAGENYCYAFLYSGHGGLVTSAGTPVGHRLFLWAGAANPTPVYDINANAPPDHPYTVENLGISTWGKMKLIYMDACRLGETWPDYGTSNIAIQFGVCSGAGGAENQAYVGFTDRIYWNTAIGFTDMFFNYLVNGRKSVDEAAIATILNSSRMDRVERLRPQQGVFPWWCWIPPR